MENPSNSAWGQTETQYFFALTPERILCAVESLGFRCTGRCVALNSMENRVYEVEIDLLDESSIKKPSDRFRVVKIYRQGRRRKEQILEEHRFLLELQAQEIPVVAPLPFADGTTLSTLKDIGIHCAVFPKAGGRIPDELNDESLERVGRLLARVHNVGAASSAPSRIRINQQTYGLDNLEYLLTNKCIPSNQEQRYALAVQRLCSLSAPLFEATPVQRIHGDCHLGNILWASEGPRLVDFDDMLQGPCVQDLWLVIPGRDQESKLQLEVLISAYEQLRPFPRQSLRLIEALRGLRFIHFSAWISRRWKDPAFPRAFPQFGSDRYWQEQVLDIEEQVMVLEQDVNAGGLGG